MNSFFLTVSRGSVSSSLASLALRLGFGILMIPMHGYAKLVHFNDRKDQFMDFFGLGGAVSLSMAIFAELFCSVLLILGLFTRLATVPLLILVLVIFSVHDWEFFGKHELVTAFFIGYVAILLTGPGRYSLDALLLKNKK